MTRNRRVALGAACAVLVAGALALPMRAEAQKVLNPGAFALQANGGQLTIGGLGLDLTPQPLPQCSDGLDNDADTRVDLLDAQCATGPNGEPASSDDSEVAPGFQPKINVSITGSIDGAGNVTIPPSGVVFPPAYVAINFNGVWVVKAEVIATENATGSIDPLTGAAVLDVRARIKLSGNVGNQLPASCSIGTVANPVRLNLITGRKEAVPNGNGAINGSPYNPTTGNAVLVDNAFSVPGATGCDIFPFPINAAINSQVGIPSAAGRNAAVVAGRTTPALARAINPVITSSAPLDGNQAPFAVTLSGANSIVAKGPATYSWAFSDGTAATGESVQKTFAAGTQLVSLTVTDGDGDQASTTTSFVVQTGTSSTTTTTTQPTTTTTSTTSTTTTSTTTTQPTTTTTSTTTTQPTTTTTSTTTTSTTTTQPTTTTTSTTTTQPTTTTTSTTVPQPSDDSVQVRLSGAVNYENGGSGNGDITVRRDASGISAATGFLELDSPLAAAQSTPARVGVSIQRAWILPLWTGQVTVRDQAAGVNLSTPVFGQIQRGDTLTSARGTSSWFVVGSFPNLLRPYTLSWSVVDAG